MTLYQRVKRKLYLDKTIIFIFACITLVSIYRFYESSFNLDLIDVILIQEFERVIIANQETFSNSPLPDIFAHSRFSFLITESDFGISYDFPHIYDMLAFHPAWVLNSVIDWLIIIGQFNIIFVGALIATTAYKNKGTLLEELSINAILKKQLLTATCFVFALIVAVATFGTIAGHFKFHFQISHVEEMHKIMDIYDNIENLWRPGILYYMQALLGVFIILISGVFFGIFIGHILKSRAIALITLFFVANYFSTILFLYPISPFYFVPRISGYLVVARTFNIPYESFIISLLLLVVYLGLIVFISKKVMGLRLKRMGKALPSKNLKNSSGL